MSVVALFSTKKELEGLMQRPDFDQLKIVALTPEADFSARDYSLKYKTIEDYYDEVQLNVKGVESLSIVEEMCNVIDKVTDSKDSKFISHDLFFFIKRLYDQLLINHSFCKGLIKIESPQKIILMNVQQLQEGIFGNCNDDLLLNSVLYFFKINNIICETIVIENQENPKKTSSLCEGLRYYKNILSSIKFSFLNLIYNNTYAIGKPKIFIVQHWDFLICTGLRKYYKTYWMQSMRSIFNLKKKNNQLPDEEILRKIKGSLSLLFKFDEVSYFDLINPKISYFLSSVCDMMSYYVEQAAQFIKKNRIEVVIAASGQSFKTFAALRAANNLEIPVIWGQHGGLYGYAKFPINKYIDKLYSHYFLYTEAISSVALGKPVYSVSNLRLLTFYHVKRT